MARLLAGYGVALALVAAAATSAYTIAARSGLERLHKTAQHRLDLIAAGIDSELARFNYLPSLLEMNRDVFRLLDHPDDLQLRNDVNRLLKEINATAGTSILYVLDLAGKGVAASDWDKPGTPFGADLSFRPYVRDALKQGRGRFYGVGITSSRPGYYLSYMLYAEGRQRGIATAKVSLEAMERSWKDVPGGVLLVDGRNVTILSSREEWKYRPLAPLTPPVLADIARTRPYGKSDLAPLEWQVKRPVSEDAKIVSVGNTTYLATERPLNQDNWRLFMLDDTAPVHASAQIYGVVTALAMSVLLLLAIVLWQRQRAVHQQLASRAALQEAHDSLESKVIARTAELLAANAQLASEVDMRKATEANLRATQNELVHAGKMAVLGQMSTGMVHEINQPLAALHTLSDNACVLLDQERFADVRRNLQRIANIVERLGRVTYQLKAFAHKSITPGAPVQIRRTIANAQFLVAQRLRERGVEIEVEAEPETLAALADEGRLEQVLVNLLGNAIDAMAGAPTRRLCINASAAGQRCVITVSDTGPGIREDILPHLFQPFITSKPAGAGLGLGLMISAHIVREFGGTLEARNLPGGGACFVIDLPLAAMQEELEHEHE
jgi:two-component system C4-dicarboxylate transport sensor histidine kinase DctB